MREPVAKQLYELNTPLQYVSDSLQFLQLAFSEMGGVFATYAQAAEVLAGKEITPEARLSLQAKIAAMPELVDLTYLQCEIPNALARCVQGLDRVRRTMRALNPEQSAQKAPAVTSSVA